MKEYVSKIDLRKIKKTKRLEKKNSKILLFTRQFSRRDSKINTQEITDIYKIFFLFFVFPVSLFHWGVFLTNRKPLKTHFRRYNILWHFMEKNNFLLQIKFMEAFEPIENILSLFKPIKNVENLVSDIPAKQQLKFWSSNIFWHLKEKNNFLLQIKLFMIVFWFSLVKLNYL